MSEHTWKIELAMAQLRLRRALAKIDVEEKIHKQYLDGYADGYDNGKDSVAHEEFLAGYAATDSSDEKRW
jgi:hypothetical protein